MSVATDLGYMSDKVKQAISDSNVLVLESNHDIEMLRMVGIRGTSSAAFWATWGICPTRTQGKP